MQENAHISALLHHQEMILKRIEADGDIQESRNDSRKHVPRNKRVIGDPMNKFEEPMAEFCQPLWCAEDSRAKIEKEKV